MEDENKLDPDALLKAVQESEKKQQLGKLKIFFGMSAGVGKTYSMLENAQNLLKDGVNVVVGVINTHGRIETEALLIGLPIIPEKWVKYKDTVFEELDIETIINTRPDIVLIDELAHTNVPGSKHPKRWQDVLEILDAGINVFTTLNVQHIESRKDLVESITGIQVRETVPDLVLERAETIEIIDISPAELLQRLKEGKVYFHEQSQLAAQNFFKEDNLTALREIALRFTAEKVDHDLHGILMQGREWKTRERLMAAISPSPSSQQLIRAARRLAFELDAPWFVIYVDDGEKLSDADQTRLTNHINLAGELGAEVIITHDLDIASAINRATKQKDITRLIIGRPPKRSRSFFNFFKKNIIDLIENENKEIDIIVLRQDKATTLFQKSYNSRKKPFSLHPYLLVIAIILFVSLLGVILQPHIGYKAVGFLYLLGIFGLSFFIKRIAIFWAAVLSAIAWDVFIPPLYDPSISDPEDIFLIVIYFIAALILGFLAARLREQNEFLRKREEQVEHLYEIEQEISASTSIESLRINVASRLEKIFDGQFCILVKDENNNLSLECRLATIADEKEQSVAYWVYQNGKPAGWSTDTLPFAEGLYLPIKFGVDTIGVLSYYPKSKRPLSRSEFNFLQTVIHHIGVFIERHYFREQMHRQDYTRQIEKVHQAIFHSFNNSFYGPIDEISKLNQQLKEYQADSYVKSILQKLEKKIFGLKLIIDNVIAISQLESGFLHVDMRSHPIQDLIVDSLADTQFVINEHPIKVKGALPEGQEAHFDIKLLKLALNNLLVNASDYSHPDDRIEIEINVTSDDFSISVCDRGSGIEETSLPFIFDKFYRVPGSVSSGLGLGLSIAKSVVEIHQGTIEAKKRPDGGSIFTITIPLPKATFL